MATTYTTNYNLGKQENHADKFDMDVITDNADKIDAALTAKADKSTTYTKTEVDTALSGKQATLTTEQLAAVNSGITAERLANDENNISSIENSIIKMVAHTSATSSTSLSYETNINDFVISGGANSDKSSGVYLIICTNWSTIPATYIGLLTFSGGTTNNFVKTDVVTGFTPTITITQNVSNATITISGAAKISIYATK